VNRKLLAQCLPQWSKGNDIYLIRMHCTMIIVYEWFVWVVEPPWDDASQKRLRSYGIAFWQNTGNDLAPFHHWFLVATIFHANQNHRLPKNRKWTNFPPFVEDSRLVSRNSHSKWHLKPIVEQLLLLTTTSQIKIKDFIIKQS